jgi:hypothetical protein
MRTPAGYNIVLDAQIRGATVRMYQRGHVVPCVVVALMSCSSVATQTEGDWP